MPSEVAYKASFSAIRYAQCWEDADVLLQALDVRPGQTCLSIASAGDNTLALLSKNPDRVIAVDLSPAQLACLELRVAGYRELSHVELLELIGSVASDRRSRLYQRCRPQLSPTVRDYWDSQPAAIAGGIGAAGKFERYFALFRKRVLPLVHSRAHVKRLLRGGSPARRHDFYQRTWNTVRWRLLFRIFFSRLVMGRLGRDPSFFQYVEGNVAERMLVRTDYATTALNPADNPYLQWILTGSHPTALPYALRPENFDSIRANLDRLEWHCQSLEDFLSSGYERAIDRYNLSDIFEYMSEDRYHRLLQQLVRSAQPGCRLVYWNMLVPRSRPASMAGQLHPLAELADRLYLADKAFFYSNLVIEEVTQ